MLPVSNNIPYFNILVKPVYGIRFPNWGVRSRVSVDGYSLVRWHSTADLDGTIRAPLTVSRYSVPTKYNESF
jgi:hypothetical protein